jgi:hypothetical protein
MVLIAAGEDDPDYPEIQRLTENLKEATATASNLTVQNLQLRWGLRPGELPFLLGCPVFDFTSETEFGDLALDILLFLALEISITPIAGHCITPDRACVGADRSVLRSKVAIYRIRKFFDGVMTGEILDDLISHLMERLRGFIPDLTLRHVSCCARCFRMYCVTGSSSLAAPSIAHDKPKSEAWRSQKKLPSGMRQFAKNRKMKSGLTIVQDTSARTCRKAVTIYLSDPFPPFFQHAKRD